MSQQLKVYNINAFTDKKDQGNPACVIQLKKWIDDKELLRISRINKVPETAFFIINNDSIHLRWFTPEIEMDLCGHATLATAHCLISILNYKKNKLEFISKSGTLIVKHVNGKYEMNLPKRIGTKTKLPEIISKSLNIQPIETLKSRDYILIYNSEAEIKNIKINESHFNKINLDPGGVVVTSKGDTVDFVSRYFTPQSSILEDPATGSSHCSLIPYWSRKLNKKKLKSLQLSKRKGEFECENKDERVLVTGKAFTDSIEIKNYCNE